MPNKSIATLLGWTLAVGVHPVAAWRVLPRDRRWVIPAGYFSAAYFIVLIALFTR
jgi:hypothetical protein